MSRVSRAPFAVLAVVIVGAACAGGDKPADSSRLPDSATVVRPAQTVAPAPPALTDTSILALFDEANMADSARGAVAAVKGTNGEVKSFGRDMMRDHHALRVAGQELATSLNIAPALSPGDTTAAQDAALKDSLTTMAAGPEWDKAYISHVIAAHRALLGMAQTALGAAQHPETKALIEKSAPNLQAHLEHASSILSKLQ